MSNRFGGIGSDIRAGAVPLVFLTKFRPPGRHAMWATIVCDPTTFTAVADLPIAVPIAWYSSKPT